MTPLEARRRILGRNVYKRTTEGNPAIAQGSLARMYPGITMQGWTERDSTTGAQLFDIASATIGAVSRITGENLEYGANWKRSDYIQVVSGQQYSCTYVANYQDTGFAFYDEQKTFLSGIPCTKNFTVPESAVFCRITVNTTDGDPNIFMFNAGSIALPYEPYTGGKPSPSPEYQQEIVSAGKYNEDTQKWEYEITIANEQTDPDKNQAVTLTADRPLTKWDKLEKRNGQWGWVYGSVESDMSSEVTWVIHPGYEQETSNLFRGAMSGVDKIDSTDMVFCNILPYHQTSAVDVNGIYSLSNYFFARIVGIKSLEDFQEKILGGKILAKLSTETFVPLSESEQEAMNALHTFRPTTVLSNDEGCEMSLTYKTKKSMGGVIS